MPKSGRLENGSLTWGRSSPDSSNSKSQSVVCLEEADGAVGLVGGAEGLGGRTGLALGEAELEVGLDELRDSGALELVGAEHGGVDDPDGGAADTVQGGDLSVHLVDGSVQGDSAVLLVHVVGARAGVEAKGDAVVLDLGKVLLNDLGDLEDLAGGSLGLVELGKEVPEARHGDGLVEGEKLHAEDLGGGVLLGGLVTADDLVQAIDGSHLFYVFSSAQRDSNDARESEHGKKEGVDAVVE